MGLLKALKKFGKFVEKETRPLHGVVRGIASGAANTIAPGSGAVVNALTGGNRGAGGVGTMLPALSGITGINVAAGKPFSFGVSLPSINPGPTSVFRPNEQAGAMAKRVLDYAGVPGAVSSKVKAGFDSMNAPRRQTVGYQGDAPPLLPSHTPSSGSTANVRQLPGTVAQPHKKYRRMNPLNPRALSRSIRRARAFEKFARRTINLNVNRKFKKHKRGRR